MDKIKAAEDYATVQIGDPAKFTNSDQHSKHECCQQDFIAGWDAALSTQSPKWVKASERLPEKSHNYHVKVWSERHKYSYNDTNHFEHGTWDKYRDSSDFVTEWLDESPSSTHPLQQKITELLEVNQGLREALESAYALFINAADTIATAIETYK